MPFVSSYFRRSAGAAGLSGGAARRLDVAIYGSDGSLLLDRAGSRYVLENLAFATGLPGGFLSAGFRLSRPAVRGWTGDHADTMIIRRGRSALWWGWIEDLGRSIRGDTETIEATALGPWQQPQQRFFSPTYSGTLYGDAAIRSELLTYCDEISTDHSQIEATGVNIASLSWTYEQISDLIKLVCEAGNSSDLPMLFALWEPTYRNVNGYPTSLLTNSNMESVSGGVPTAWTFIQMTGDPVLSSTTIYQQSGAYGTKIARGAAAGTQEGRISESDIVVAPSTAYTFDYQVYFGAVSGITSYVSVDWYTTGGVYISTASTTTRTSTGTAGWNRYSESLTSPATAGKATIKLRGGLPDSGANSFKVYDDVYMFVEGTAPDVDTKPRPHLWARDLSEADYLLYTADLDTPLGIAATTRQLANKLAFEYESGTTTTQDTDSQATYRQRDYYYNAGSISGPAATGIMNSYLERYKEPQTEPGSFRISRPGAIRTATGRIVDPVLLRAGDRIKLADGEYAGTIFMLEGTSWADGVMSCRPEQGEAIGQIVARALR